MWMVRLLADKFWQVFRGGFGVLGERIVLTSEFANVLSPGHFHLPSIPLRQRVYERGCYHHLHPAGKM